jgi:ribonuclease VapC
MVVDTSAVVAILADEPGREWLSAQLAGAERKVMAAPTALELGIVLEARTPAAVGIAQRVLRDARVELVPFGDELEERAMHAWRRFGKAGLNLGDCFTYALAEETGFAILCVGDDFGRTDLPVLSPPTA